ncbi:MAG: hypothetical protein WBG92_12670 [Thiohalocapsa sp.]
MNSDTIRTAIVAVALTTALVTGCDSDDGPAENAGARVDQAAENAGEAVNEAGESVSQGVERAGDKVESATD